MNAISTTMPPIFSISAAAAKAVPPVASRSSTRMHPLAFSQRVLVDLDPVRAVLKRIFLGLDLGGKLALLPDGDETLAERVGQRRADDEAARLDADDRIELKSAWIYRWVSVSMTSRKPTGSLMSVVMSRNMIPFLG